MRPALVYFGVRATDGGSCLFKLVPYVSYKFSSVSTKRFPSALSYFLAINPSSPSPRPARLPPTSHVGRGSRSRSILHISFVSGCAPGGWARPGFVLPELQGRWPVARKLKLTVKNTRIWAPMVVLSTGRERRLCEEHYAVNTRTIVRYYVVKRKQLFSYNCN